MKQKPFVEDIETYAQDIVDTVREPLLILDTTLRVRSANRAFYQTFQVSSEETENRLIYELGNGQWDIPALRTLLEDIIPTSSVFNDFELEHTFPIIGRRIMLLNGRKLRPGSHTELLVLAMEDVTERRRSEADLKAIETYAQNIVDTVREPLLILDTTLRVRSANRAFYQTFQVSLEETENRLIYELGNGQWDIPVLRNLLEDIVPLSSVFNDFEWEHDFPVIGRRVMLLNARKLQAGHHGELLVLAMEDVTERRRSEADLKAIETYAQNIVDTVREPLLILDTTLRVRSANRAFYQTFHVTSEETENRLIYELGNGQWDIPDLRTLLEDVVPKSSVFNDFELEHTFPVIGRRVMLLNARKLQAGHHGELLVLAMEDVTARKRAEEALLKAGALQSAIFNSANFSSIATDEKGVIQIFNVGAERMLGYTAAEVKNKITPADISDPQEVITRAKALSTELATTITPGFEALVFKASRGIEDIYELTYIRKDGSRFPAIVSVTALRDAQEGIIGYLLIGTDNTARKQVEAERMLLDQRVRDQQFYTRSLIESNIDALIATDPRGIITDVNKQMEALTGCTRDELIGAPFKNYFTDPERAEAGIKRVLTGIKVTDYELTACARDGKETVVSYNATTFYDRDRKLQGVFAAARDVTERKHFEQTQLENNVELERAKAAAEKANLAKSDFLSSMSHELRSPLNAILGFAQLMSSDSPPPTPAQMANIDPILHAGWYLLELINEILDLAQIESGKLALSLEPTSLEEVMLECQAMIEPQGQKRGIGMTFPRFDIPCFVDADRTRLKQVIINLLSKAIKYNRTNGTVVVSCSRISAERVRIGVRDTGAGLPPEMLIQLFQSFNRLGRESTAEEGTGIGLVMSKRLVEMMGGAIGVESTVGSGSVFWFDLNSAVAPHLVLDRAESPEIVQPQVLDGAPLRTLLYVEDNPANLKLVEQLIARRPDMRLLSARDGNRGVELAIAHRPDVILMDINLPGISGIEALKILREDAATGHIPVVALSANAMPRDVEKGLIAGFFRYLTKPIKINEFMETLDVALKFVEQGASQSK